MSTITRKREREKEREWDRYLCVEIKSPDVNYRVYASFCIRTVEDVRIPFKSTSFLRSGISQRPSATEYFGWPMSSMPSGRQRVLLRQMRNYTACINYTRVSVMQFCSNTTCTYNLNNKRPSYEQEALVHICTGDYV